MGFGNNTVLFVLLFMLNTSLKNHICICKASHEDLCIPSERQALLNFKHHLLDPSNRLASWSENTNCCNWTSVVCNNVSGHILQLHLRTSRSDDYVAYEYFDRSWFGGEIDPSILALSYLSHLDLSGNDFGSMQIPSFLGSIKSLTYLNLSYAGFSGSIPQQIGNISNLLHLDLGGNYFTGKIPHQLGNLSNLQYLCLYGGTRQGMDGLSIYVENLQWISSLSSLQYLKLSYVNLSISFDWFHVLQSLPLLSELHLPGCALPHHFHPAIPINFSSLVVLDLSSSFEAYSISKWIFQLKNLVSLQLQLNFLQGPIPNGIQNLTLLEDLDLSYNLFNSSIPDWLYTLTHLKSLSLSSNILQGPISHAIGNLTSMVTLDLSKNQLEGPIPSSLSSLCNLRRADFSNIKLNQQVSEIIEIISNCASHTLQALSISSAQLIGYLTPRIGVFKNLVILDLSVNQIDGNPFDAIQSLSKLQLLDISDNTFQGVTNEYHLANFTDLIRFYASRNKLILNVSSDWNPSFQKLKHLYMELWHLGPKFPSWIQSLKYLSSLCIPNNNISNSIPIWVWDAFPHASYFDFSNNDIHGDLSHTLKNSLNVPSIDLSSNQLSGPLPHISPYVHDLDFSSNYFSGSIATFLCQKQKEPMRLEYLNLASNNLSGDIPDCWKMWSNIEIIKLDNNYFRGNLPTSIGSLPWLNSLQLSNNTLSGVFPSCLKNNTKLVLLDLRENQFSGIIPPLVGEVFLNLNVFLLKSNRFIGEIPRQICLLNSLQILDLAQNNLTGPIPKCIKHLRVMQVERNVSNLWTPIQGQHSVYSISDVLLGLKGRDYLYKSLGLITSIDLSDNKISGEIPREITSFRGLIFLNLSHNLLSGKIPQNIGTMASLESMDLSNNQLYGAIPLSMSNLSFLNSLNLSYNNLWGKIPTGTQLQSFEAISFVGNHLCGPPLPNNCSDWQHVLKHDHNAKEPKDGINWFYVSMSLGFVSGFWAVVGPLLYSRSWRHTYFLFLDYMWCKLQSYWC